MQNITKNLAVQEVALRSDLKTRTWFVYNAKRQILGKVSWERPWRQYAFVPTPKTIFSPGYLDEISAFARRQTAEHRKAAQNDRNLALQQCG
jgi:hypothetical protein